LRARDHLSVRLSFVLWILVAVPMFAYRREYIVTDAGERKPGSEVCFYRGTSVSDAFSLYFSHDRVACLPADAVLDLPSGLFHVFARHPDGYISGSGDFFVMNGPPAPEAGYGALEIPVKRAARIDFSDVLRGRRAGERVGVWVAPTAAESGHYIPLVDGEAEMLVPADRPFLPLVIGKGVPVAIGEPLVLTAGRRAKISPFEAPDAGVDLVGWVKVERGEEDVAGIAPRPPDVFVEAAGARIEPLFPLVSATGATHTLMFFKGLPLGPGRVAIRGKTWVHSDIDVPSTPGVAIMREPIRIVAAAALSVIFEQEPVISAPEPCSAGSLVPSEITTTLMTCTPAAGGFADCKPVARQTSAFTTKSPAEFEGVPAGAYKVVVRAPAAKPIEIAAELRAGEERALQVPLPAFRFFGTVRINGRPVVARLFFGTGEAQSDSGGRFTAALARAPQSDVVRVATCMDGRTRSWIATEAVAENSELEIDIREHPFVVMVQGKRGEPVVGARVFLSGHKSEYDDAVHYISPEETTGEGGRAVFATAPLDQVLGFCAEHDAYIRTCAAPIPVSEVKSRKVAIIMDSPVARGRVVGHEGRGVLNFVDELGRVTEEILVLPDGRFNVQHRHGEREHVVYASTQKPLTVFARVPVSGEGELIVTLPAVPVRAFTVTVADMRTESGYLALWVANRYVPIDTLVFHHDSRGSDVVVQRGRPVEIRDIAATGPMAVSFVADIPAPGPFVDPFTRPENLHVRRYPVTGTAVTIPAR
jgi:hypothetical protein